MKPSSQETKSCRFIVCRIVSFHSSGDQFAFDEGWKSYVECGEESDAVLAASGREFELGGARHPQNRSVCTDCKTASTIS
jgi:hypothetical protein